MYLSINNQDDGFQLPINPSSIEASEGSNGQTYDIIKLGEINVIKARSLTQYSFEGIFPAQRYPYLSVESPRTPKAYVEDIEKWIESKRPIRFVYTGKKYANGKSFEINEAVSIESFNWKETAGHGGDITYSLKLKKYVFYAARRISIQGASRGTSKSYVAAPATRPNDTQPPKVYAVVAGDTLWAIAKRTLGASARWKEIQSLNKLTDSQVKSLRIGQSLKIPR